MIITKYQSSITTLTRNEQIAKRPASLLRTTKLLHLHLHAVSIQSSKMPFMQNLYGSILQKLKRMHKSANTRLMKTRR